MKDNQGTINTGIGFTELLQIAFIVLKLCKVINWSWLWVLAPLWISLVLAVIWAIILGIWINKNDRLL